MIGFSHLFFLFFSLLSTGFGTPTSNASPAVAPAGGFSFGSGASPAGGFSFDSGAASPAGGFSFGTGTSPAGGFSFGSGASASPATAPPPSVSGFEMPSSSSSSAAASSSVFNFGGASFSGGEEKGGNAGAKQDGAEGNGYCPPKFNFT